MFMGPSPPHNFPGGSDGKASACNVGPGLENFEHFFARV